MKLRSHMRTLLQGGGGRGAVYLANLCIKSYYAAPPVRFCAHFRPTVGLFCIVLHHLTVLWG